MERGFVLTGEVLESKDGSYLNRKTGATVDNHDVTIKCHDFQGGVVRTFGTDTEYGEGEEVSILVDVFAKINTGQDGGSYAKLNVKRLRRL